VFKYTDTPDVTVEVAANALIGTYKNDDTTEKVELYKFDIYKGETIIETSDWLVHNATQDTEMHSSKDTYVP